MFLKFYLNCHENYAFWSDILIFVANYNDQLNSIEVLFYMTEFIHKFTYIYVRFVDGF